MHLLMAVISAKGTNLNKNAMTLFVKAGLKMGRQLTPSVISNLQALEITEEHHKVVYRHFGDYEHFLDWPSDYFHPCYLQMATFHLQIALLTHRQSPFKLFGLVHLHNHIVQQPDFQLGQPFDLKVTFGKVMRHPRGVMVEVVLRGFQKSKVVYQVTSTYLDKSKAPVLESIDFNSNQHLPYVPNLEDGLRRNLKVLELDLKRVRQYAMLSKDYNPIHLSPLFAKMFGFKHAIAHGMYTLSRILAVEDKALNFKPSDEPIVVSCDFYKPVYVPYGPPSKTQIVTGSLDGDRLVSLHDIDEPDIKHLVIRYARGEATRLHRRF